MAKINTMTYIEVYIYNVKIVSRIVHFFILHIKKQYIYISFFGQLFLFYLKKYYV